jgi:uncharacterized protein YegL
MKNNITELVFILDKSGSMHGFEADTVGGFNATVEKQRETQGKVYVSTVLFNSTSEVIHDRVDISQIHRMTVGGYRVGGCTALLDALGDAIRHIGNIHKYARPEDVPEHTIFVIMTDGMENASSRYSAEAVRAMVRKQTEKYGWEFIFLAANIDAIAAAEHIGIASDRAAGYAQTSEGIDKSYRVVNKAIHHFRADRCTRKEMNLSQLFEEEE